MFFTSVWKNAVIVPLVGHTCHLQHSFLFDQFHPIINQLIINKRENATGPCTKLGVVILSFYLCLCVPCRPFNLQFFDGNFVGISSFSSGMIQASHPHIQSHPPLSYHPDSIGVNCGEDEDSCYAVFTSLFLRPKDSLQQPFLTDPNQIQLYLNMSGCISCMTLAPIQDLHGADTYELGESSLYLHGVYSVFCLITKLAREICRSYKKFQFSLYSSIFCTILASFVP